MTEQKFEVTLTGFAPGQDMTKAQDLIDRFWVHGLSPFRQLHEYLMEEDYYESINVGTKARSDYWCEHCSGKIPKGQPHTVHKFYPEFNGYRTHHKCEQEFVASLRTEADGPSG